MLLRRSEKPYMNIETLKKTFAGDVDNTPETLLKYSQDASLFQVMPELVVFPKNSADVQNLVRWANAENATLQVGRKNNQKGNQKKISITARSAGTCMSGGAINDSVIADFTRYMNRLGEVDVEHKQLVTEPGVFYRDFEKATLAKNLMYPTYPASKDICAMGGIVANNGAGEKSLRYGKAENYVIQTKVVFTDGNEYLVKPLTKPELDQKMAQNDFEGSLYKSLFEMIEKNYDAIKNAQPNVSKNSAGYYLWNVWDKQTQIFDLNKLIVGSQGTLGLVTEATFRLVDVQPHAGMLAIFMHDLSNLGQIVNDALYFKPESVEAYDDKTITLALKFWTGFIAKKGLFGAIKLGISFLPELWLMIRGGMPKLVILVEFTGQSEEEIMKSVIALEQKMKAYSHVETKRALTPWAEEKYWTIRRDAFSLLREHYKGRRTAPFIDDVIVPPEVFPEFLPKLEKILDDNKLIYNIHGHAGNGNFHIIPLMDMHDTHNREVVLDVANKVYDLVLSYKGSITAEHNDGIVRTPYLEKMYGPFITGLFKLTKSLCDPENIFNPGKKVGDTKDYLKNHIRIEH